MKNRNIILVSVSILVLIPQTVLAVWWNPFSWFDNRKNVKTLATSTVIEISSEQKIKDNLYKEYLKEQSAEVEKTQANLAKKTNATVTVSYSKDISGVKAKKIEMTNPSTQKTSTSSFHVSENNDKECADIKNEFKNFDTQWARIDFTMNNSITKSLNNNLVSNFGLNSSVFNGSDFDAGYRKYLEKKGSFYSNIEDLRLATLDLSLSSFGERELESMKIKINKASDLFKESFDLTLLGYSLMSNDKYAYFMGRKIMPEQNLDDSKSNLLQGIEKSKNALNYLLSSHGDYEKIKQAYNESLLKLNCK